MKGNTLRQFFTALIVALSLAMPAGLLASDAMASTPGCAAQVPDYCGSQQVTPQPGVNLMMAAPNKALPGAAVLVKVASGTDAAPGTNSTEDFSAINPPNPVDNAKVFKYTPNGVLLTGPGFRGGLCVTASGRAVRSVVVLEPCTNATAQQWIAGMDLAGNFYWQLRGSSYVLSDPNGGPAYTMLQLRNFWDGPNQLWTAIYPPAIFPGKRA